MKNLQEFVQFTNKNKTKNIAILGEAPKEFSYVHQLYDAILGNKVSSDEEAAQLLFGKPDLVRYQKIKHQLRKRLLNTLFFIDLKQEYFTAYDRAYYDCHKSWTGSLILLRRGAISTGMELMEKVFSKAEKFEFTMITLHCATRLKYYYGTLLGDVKKFNYYRKKATFYNQVFQAESLVEDYYETLILNYVKSKSTQAIGLEIATIGTQELNKQAFQPSTNRYLFFYNFLVVAKYSAINDYQQVIRECQRALARLNQKDNVPYGFLRSFLYQKIVSHTQLKQYEEGMKSVNECLQYVEKARGDRAWFKVMELSTNLSLHAQHYQEAFENLEEVTHHKKFKTLQDNQQEIWFIYRAYIAYLIKIGKIENERKQYHKFKVSKFINSLPIFSKDKSGMNIPILIIQSLLYLIDEKYDLAYDSILKLETYGSRYLRKDNNNFRSHCFIKMLAQLPKGNFHRAAVQRKAATYVKRLQEVPIDVSDQSHDLEIVPYEHLWEMVIEQLDFTIH